MVNDKKYVSKENLTEYNEKLKDKVKGYLDAKANDSAVVHNTDNEDINGKKKFLQDITIALQSGYALQMLGGVATGTIPTADTKVSTISVRDSTNATDMLGMYHKTFTGSGKTEFGMVLKDYNGANAKYLCLINDNGSGYVTIPNRTYDATNTMDAVNIGMLEAKVGNYVGIANDEEITGAKTFTKTITSKSSDANGKNFIARNNNPIGTKPSVATSCGYFIRPADSDTGIGYISHTLETNGNGKTSIGSRDYNAGNNASLIIYSLTDGTTFATAPARTYDPANTLDVVNIGTLSPLLDGKLDKTTITSGTIDKVYMAKHDGTQAVTDIVNDLTTGGTNKVLSAEQGKSLSINKQDAFGSATDGQSIRYDAVAGKWVPYSMPTSVHLYPPSTGDEIQALTPTATEGTFVNCTADSTDMSFRAGQWYILTVESGTRTWHSVSTTIDMSIYQPKAVSEANKVLISGSDKNITVSTLDSSKLAFLASVTTDIQSQLDGKEPTLTFDTAPTSGSTNPVTSGGILTALNAKAPKSHATSGTTYGVSSASNYGHAKASGTSPKMNGTAAVGSETGTFARGDHVHPSDTTKLDASALVTAWSTTTLDTNIPSEKLVKAGLDGKVTANTAIAGTTKCKITYDSKGLVTAGANLAIGDLPSLTTAKTTLLTGYTIATAESDLATTDSLNGALGKLQYAVKQRAKGTGTIGTATKPVYLNNGTITAGTYTLGNVCALSKFTSTDTTSTASDTNVYTALKVNGLLTGGAVTKVGTASVGSGVKPIYLNAGTPTVSGSTVGSATQPVYLSGGTITAGTSVIANKLTGYAIASTASAIATTDTILQAFAKLEKRIKTLEDANLVRYG